MRNPTAAAFRRALEDRLKSLAGKDPARLARYRKRVVFDRLLPVTSADGTTIELLADYGGAAVVVGQVDQAWAVDAAGNAVESSYQIEGNTLVQVIAPNADVTYPVVADPKRTRTWWNTAVYFNPNETALLAGGAGGIAVVAGTIPDPTISKVIAAVAGLAGLYIGTVRAMNKCIKAVSYGHVFNPVWQPYAGAQAGGYCR